MLALRCQRFISAMAYLDSKIQINFTTLENEHYRPSLGGRAGSVTKIGQSAFDILSAYVSFRHFSFMRLGRRYTLILYRLLIIID